ncbi:MAG: restriction endonuclease subunit S, partial [bacterium]
NATILRSVPILVARRRPQDLYASNVESSSEMCEVLNAQNQQLSAARDLLLPRLMSGEIAV